MDELTRERYPHGVPSKEAYALPLKPRPYAPAWLIRQRRVAIAGTADLDGTATEAYPQPPRPVVPGWLIRERREILCGTADLDVIEPGGATRTAINRDRRLVDAIRTYNAGQAEP